MESTTVTATRVDYTITVANIVAILTFAFVFAVAWGRLNARLEAAEIGVTRQEEARLMQDGRVREIELAATRSDTRIENIITLVQELRVEQRKTNELLRSIKDGQNP